MVLFAQELIYQLSHNLFPTCILVFKFACPAVSHMPSLVDQIYSRPELLSPTVPVIVSLIQEYRIGNAKPLNSPNDVCRHFLVRRFGCMNTDEYNALFGKVFLPFAVTRQVVDAVDSTESPELDNCNLAST